MDPNQPAYFSSFLQSSSPYEPHTTNTARPNCSFTEKRCGEDGFGQGPSLCSSCLDVHRYELEQLAAGDEKLKEVLREVYAGERFRLVCITYNPKFYGLSWHKDLMDKKKAYATEINHCNTVTYKWQLCSYCHSNAIGSAWYLEEFERSTHRKKFQCVMKNPNFSNTPWRATTDVKWAPSEKCGYATAPRSMCWSCGVKTWSAPARDSYFDSNGTLLPAVEAGE